jgi:hypothetical protein
LCKDEFDGKMNNEQARVLMETVLPQLGLERLKKTAESRVHLEHCHITISFCSVIGERKNTGQLTRK